MSKIVCTVTNDLVYDQRMIRICTSLQKQHDVILVGRVLENSPVLVDQSFKQHRIKCVFTKGPAFYVEYNLRLIVFFFKYKPQTINTIDVDTAFSAAVFRQFNKVHWVFDAHEYFAEVPEVTHRKIVKKIWSVIEGYTFGNADKAYTVSESLAEIFQKKYNKKVDVIRNVPFLRYKNVVKPQSDFSEKGFLIYQGALNKGRCVDLYIKAMHQIDAHLLLVGEGDLSEELRKLVEVENLAHKVTFTGKIQPEDLRHVTKNALMGLNVLENIGLSYYYSLSNKCFDYVQAGVPSISSKFPAYVALNEEYEVMTFAEPTVSSIVQAVKELQTNKDLYLRLKENCKAAAASWNWEREEIKLLAQYEK